MQTQRTTSRFLNLIVLLPIASLVAQGGDITGKVSGGKGISVVYVESIPGKTFPPPAKPLEMDQKSLLFQPHLLVAPVGATVEFLNSDKVAHNIFWPAINGKYPSFAKNFNCAERWESTWNCSTRQRSENASANALRLTVASARRPPSHSGHQRTCAGL